MKRALLASATLALAAQGMDISPAFSSTLNSPSAPMSVKNRQARRKADKAARKARRINRHRK